MTTAGSNITKANITASMAALADTFNSGITWGSDNQPFQTDITGGSTSGYSQSLASDISDTNVTASTIVASFVGYAKLLSRIRQVRLIKWYQVQGDPRNYSTYDSTNITNLNSNYETIFAMDYNPAAGGTISASALDDFVNYLSNGIGSNRVNTVTIDEYYCHSNCHGSCHGSI